MFGFLKPTKIKMIFLSMAFVVPPFFLLFIYPPGILRDGIKLLGGSISDIVYYQSASLLLSNIISGVTFLTIFYILSCIFVEIFNKSKEKSNIWTSRIVAAIFLIIIGLLSSNFLYGSIFTTQSWYWNIDREILEIQYYNLPFTKYEISDADCNENGTAKIYLRNTGTELMNLGTCIEYSDINGAYECGDVILYRFEKSEIVSMNVTKFSQTQISPGETAFFEDRSCADGDLCYYILDVADVLRGGKKRASVQC